MPRKYYADCPGCGEPDCAPVLYDARGIPLGRACADCEGALLARYRPEVLTNPRYETDEPIEPEPEIY